MNNNFCYLHKIAIVRDSLDIIKKVSSTSVGFEIRILLTKE